MIIQQTHTVIVLLLVYRVIYVKKKTKGMMMAYSGFLNGVGCERIRISHSIHTDNTIFFILSRFWHIYIFQSCFDQDFILYLIYLPNLKSMGALDVYKTLIACWAEFP